ncbi:MAG: S-layer homology domain-containing protein [Firmicutes bacterium]|jgi:hypothetical protein|nr:S-layer homology domain-containing protein [Bacillota bacterium]
MMKLRKTLVTLLVVSMIIAGFTGVAGAAFSDTANHPAKNKIAKLAALGVLAGYPDGTFKPDNNITRAEFAKIACIVAGLKSSGDILKNSPSKFSDVAVGQWYTGWVNLAASQGYMKGYPDGTFKPSANISNAEVLTVLLRIIGYNDNLPGEWPIEYLVKAADLGVSDNVTFDASEPATRGDVAFFAEQSLGQETVYWDKDQEKFKDEDPDAVNDLYHQSFEGGISKRKLVTEWEYVAGKYKLTLKDGTTVVVAPDVTLVNADHVSGFRGKLVDYILNDDDEAMYIEAKDYGNEFARSATKISDTKFKINDKIFTVASDAIYEDENGDIGDFEDLDNETYEVTYDRISMTVNSSGEVVYVKFTKLAQEATPAIVEAVNLTSKKITYLDKGQQSETNALNTALKDDTKTVIFLRNGAPCELKDLKKNDLVWIYDDDDAHGADYLVEVWAKTVEGELTETSSDWTAEGRKDVYIDGTKYRSGRAVGRILLSTDAGDADSFEAIDSDDDLDDVRGEEVTCLLDGFGYVRAIISDVTVASYTRAIVARTYSTITDEGETVTKIDVFKSDGTKASYEVDEDSDDDCQGLAKGDFVKFSLQSNGAIDDLKVITDVAQLTDADDDTHRLELDDTDWYYASGAVVFEISATSSSDWKIVPYADLEAYVADRNDVEARYELDEDNGKIKYLVVADPDITGIEDYAMALLRGKNADGKFIKLDVKGTTKTYNLTDSCDVDEWLDVADGNMLSFKLTGGKISAFDVLIEGDPGVTVGKEVYSVAASDDRIKIDGVWYHVDDDTVIYDYSGDDLVYCTLSDLVSGMTVDFYDKGGDKVLEWIVVR